MASAQTTWQPTPAPTTTAENEAWYRSGEPIPYGDTLYYSAGATVFFNRYQMVRSGTYRGIPLYTDSTQDSFGIIYVPIGARSDATVRATTNRRPGRDDR